MGTQRVTLGTAVLIGLVLGARAGLLAHADDSVPVAPPAASQPAPITLVNAPQVDLIRALEGPTDWARCVAFEPGGPLLAVGSKDGTVRLWNVDAGGPPAVLRAAPC